ncbi:biopolymer transport protein ExbB [Geothermobacter ehrlichii]|uniref:Biopolymer transport protein ExbB n=1 Tax=Geothermobacter ehrlichii TaxID=213224 RepID=A0A5D3WMU3_9BACT|nr:MotA/TolQ/ExbB proton channel family protein [Geothermobacter ehrlichii]TYO99696.1 biopolymer transport protein ExbB [Geothermobacter ehrlichii]
MLELFVKGGPLMWPLLACSVLALAIFIVKLLWFARQRREGRELFKEVVTLAQEERFDEAIIVCRQSSSPLAQVLLAALRQAGRPREHVKTVAGEVAGQQSVAFERYLGLLSTIGTISPLLGLLGTVVGMIEAFNVIATVGVGTPQTLGGGISQALITTATGMAVAIPVILAHRFLLGQMKSLVVAMEEYILRIVDLVGD